MGRRHLQGVAAFSVQAFTISTNVLSQLRACTVSMFAVPHSRFTATQNWNESEEGKQPLRRQSAVRLEAPTIV